tara:strand:- start:613 stop:1386 length:774 start_codon:yes stop_codon:yes gene_type:complete
MSTLSFSGRAILNGIQEGGFPTRITNTPSIIHTAVDGTKQLDTLYIYGFSCRRAIGPVAPVQIEVTVLDKNNQEYVLTTITLPGLPCTSPTLIVNGQVKNNGARIKIRAVDGDASIFGWYNRSTITLPPSVNTLIGQMSLGYQTIAFASDNETRIIDTATPLSFITTSHTSSGRTCRATLGSAAVGTIKIIVMSGKHPAASGNDQGNCTIIPNASRFPSGETGTATGTLTFQDVGDSAILVYSGVLWMLVGTGAVVD